MTAEKFYDIQMLGKYASSYAQETKNLEQLIASRETRLERLKRQYPNHRDPEGSIDREIKEYGERKDFALKMLNEQLASLGLGEITPEE